VAIARRDRDAFWAETARSRRRPRPLVAASVGPFGAFLADGSEYRGEYALDELALADFHRRRLATLVAAGPDLLACETIPCLREARALVRLIGEFPGICCWVSFTARDGHHISNGERIRDCARWLHEQGQVAAVGINCTPPRFVDSLIDEIRRETDKPIVVYPNSGEEYDAGARVWRQSPVGGKPFGELARGWFARGARLIGGCCRTTPDDISDIAAWARKA